MAGAILLGSLISMVQGKLVQWSVWDGGNGHFYEAVAVPAGITWTEASEAANAAGGHLATITSEAENSFVFSLVDDDRFWFEWVSLQGPWLGGYIFDISGNYDSAFILCIVCFGIACMVFWIAAPRNAAKLRTKTLIVSR